MKAVGRRHQIYNMDQQLIKDQQEMSQSQELGSSLRVVCNQRETKQLSNKIKTSKYSVVSFLPKNLVNQFSKLPNVYFLLIGFLQMVPSITTSNGVPVILGPLAFILLVTAMKDLFEDLKRHSQDNAENQKKVLRLDTSGVLVSVAWESLRRGDVVKILRDEFFPADLLILSTSEKKNICYIETKNLDGETNLKNKKAHKDFEPLVPRDPLSLSQHGGEFEYEVPNPYLYTFTGFYQFRGDKVPLDHANFVLRGCSLRNTAHIWGLVGYTGHETKLLLNSVKARAKMSQVDRKMNVQVLSVFIVQLVFCLLCALASAGIFSYNKDSLENYIRQDLSDMSFLKTAGLRVFNWLLIFTNFVPISLLVTLEVVKFMQGIIISRDSSLKTDDIPVNVQSSQLNEELGQIEYIFSDKTGTLTCNKMDFKYCCIEGMSYGGKQSLSRAQLDQCPKVTNVDFADANLFLKIDNQDAKVHENQLALALCHTIITERLKGSLEYNASSPDELALVNFAKFSGYEYTGTDDDNFMTVNARGKELKYKILQVLEFNSSRKRQSVILRDPQGKIVLYTKGADSVIEKRFKASEREGEVCKATWKNLEGYANQGLRTLVVAKRVIGEEEYQGWSKKYLEACTAMTERTEKMEEVQEEIEQQLELVGATAIEDKLQDQVGETISYLRKTGIKVWVLTGDKIETAINIGFSCQLINANMQRLIVDGVESDQVAASIKEALCQVGAKEELPTPFCLVVSGDALIVIMNDHKMVQDILLIAKHCESVLACRVSPKQKMEVVNMVRKAETTATTLAIGDGANDVNMITAAHCGIGIKGVEGHQAARASDYSVGEFKHIRKLMLYYGRESYRKNTTVIIYNFYKNMVYVMPQFWLAFLNQFSGQNMFDPFIFQMYNIAYASLPIMLYALSDEEFSSEYLTTHPRLYRQGMQNLLFNSVTFWKGVLNGMLQAMLITIPSLYVLQDDTFVTQAGHTYSFWAAGMVVFGAVVYVTNFKILLISHTLNPVQALVLLASVLFYYANYALVSAYIPAFDIYQTYSLMVSSPVVYLLFIFHFFATTLLELAYTKFTTSSKQMKEAEYQNLFQSTSDHEVEREEQKETLSARANYYRGFSFSQDEPLSFSKKKQTN